MSFLDLFVRLSTVKDGVKRKNKNQWRLGDVVDLEVLLETLPLDRWKQAWQQRGEDSSDAEDEKGQLSEKERRRNGYWVLVKSLRDQENEESVGERLTSSLRLLEGGMAVVMFFLGIALVRGLLTTFHYQEMSPVGNAEGLPHVIQERGFNVWVFLALTLGVQWFILISATLGYVFWRKWSGGLSFFQGMLSGGIQSWMRRHLKKRERGGGDAVRAEVRMWKQILGGVGGEVWSWRLTRMLQSGSIGYNLGMIAGLFGCLWFLNVGYFWETSLPQFGGQSLHRVTQIISSPVGGELVTENDIALTQAGSSVSRKTIENADIVSGLTPRMRAYLAWSAFFFFALFVWGLLPRIAIWVMAWWKERRALAMMDFQESRHRSLWRELNRVQRGEVASAPTDGVVVLDVGGIDVEMESLRPYFLQVLRVNPEVRFSLGTLDSEGERKAMDAARSAAMGVVFLVEGWNLSPKQMAIYHGKVREAIGDRHMIRYLVLNASDEEMKQWIGFVDGLKDSETEVFRYTS